MQSFFDVMTAQDIFYAFCFAVIVYFMVKRVIGGYKVVGVSGDIIVNYDANNLKSVLKNCYMLFPKDSLFFRGVTFKRGMKVQVETVSNKVITGEIVGLNNEDMLCLITPQYIIAQDLAQISQITQVHKEQNKKE